MTAPGYLFQSHRLTGPPEMVGAAWDIILLLHSSMEIPELLGPLVYLPFRDLFFTPTPCWTQEHVRLPLFSVACFGKTAGLLLLGSHTQLGVLLLPLWPRPGGPDFLGSASSGPEGLSLSVGQEDTHPTAQDFLQIFSLWPWSLLWKIQS